MREVKSNMAKYRVVGTLKGKKYRSRFYPTEKAAILAGYGMVYTPGGNRKRKTQLYSWHVEKAG